MTGIIDLEDVVFSYPGGKQPVLNGMSLTVPKGERMAILGANGSGKTTLFHTIVGVNKPQQGRVLHGGTPIEYTRKGLQEVRSETAVVLQNPDEQIFCTIVEEDVAFGPLNVGLSHEETEERIEQALREVRLTEYRRRPLQQLSGGQRKRVAIAGALAMRPEIMIMDEPTAGLDPQSAMEVMELVEKLSIQGVTVLLSTHDLDLVYSWAENASVINDGKIRFSGSQDDLYSDPSVVYHCGLCEPSLFRINASVSAARKMDRSPYPHTNAEVLAKFSNTVQGRVLCVPCSEDDAKERYQQAVADYPDARIGIYGSEARYGLTEMRKDYLFDGIDRCMADAVAGKDTILIYDNVYEPLVKRATDRIRQFGHELTEEVL